MRRMALVASALALVFANLPADAEMGQGTATGTVIVTGEGRVVVQPREGGQITFEAGMKRVGDRYVPNEENIKFIKTLKAGDKVHVDWGRDHAGHYYIRTIRKLGDEGHGGEGHHAATRERSPAERELHALHEELSALRREIEQLKELIHKLLEERK